MNKIFLTGSSGFLGDHIFRRLKKENIYLYNRDENLDNMVEYDPEVIIHAAGEVYEEKEMFKSNAELTYKLLQKARNLKNLKAFVYVGSSSEYGRKDHPIKEDELLEPTNLYEATKGFGTLLCKSFYHEFGVPTVVARPFSLFGEREPLFRFIPKAIQSAKAAWEFKIAEGVHDWLYVEDFVSGILMLAENPVLGEVVNFGTGKQTSNEDILTMIENIVGRKTTRIPVGKIRKYDSSCWVADISKASKLGWYPRYSLKEALRLTVESYI